MALHSASDDSVVAALYSALQLALQYFPLSFAAYVGAAALGAAVGALLVSATVQALPIHNVNPSDDASALPDTAVQPDVGGAHREPHSHTRW